MDEVEYPKGRLYRLNVALSKGVRSSEAGSLDALEDRTEDEIRYHLAQGHIVEVVAEPEPEASLEQNENAPAHAGRRTWQKRGSL